MHDEETPRKRSTTRLALLLGAGLGTTLILALAGGVRVSGGYYDFKTVDADAPSLLAEALIRVDQAPVVDQAEVDEAIAAIRRRAGEGNIDAARFLVSLLERQQDAATRAPAE